jgi:hypothetical protein
MIEKDSVLVVGAGASVPYGFPTGARLRTEIIDLTEKASVASSNKGELHRLVEELCEPQVLADFSRDFKDSPRESIDIFIGSRPEFSDVGKVAIAAVLCGYERGNYLYGFDDRMDDDWLQSLFNNYLNRSTSIDEFGQNKLKIITFNYDRSIEHRLTMALKSTYGITYPEAKNAASQTEIIHVHGQLGGYFGNDGLQEVHYSSTLNEQKLRLAAKSISYFFEDGEDTRLKKIRKILAAAERIAFLGFGYDLVNLNRLISPKEEGPLPSSDREFAQNRRDQLNQERMWKAKRITGTIYGLPAVRVSEALEVIGGVTSRTIEFKDMRSRELLESSAVF